MESQEVAEQTSQNDKPDTLGMMLPIQTSWTLDELERAQQNPGPWLDEVAAGVATAVRNGLEAWLGGINIGQIRLEIAAEKAKARGPKLVVAG